MLGRKVSTSIVALAASLAALGDAPLALACPLLPAAPQAATTTYRPLYAAAPAVSQSVNYMPFTAYRTVLMPTQVASLQPATQCNACGGATTVLRPVTRYAMRPQLVPYTSYQPVAAQAIVAQPAIAAPAPCGACAASPAVATYAVARPLFGVPLVNSQLTTSTGLPPVYAAPACGCGAPAAAAPLGSIGATVPSLAAPSLTSGQQFAAPAASGPSTFASPSGALYGGTVPPGAANFPPAPFANPAPYTAPAPYSGPVVSGSVVSPVPAPPAPAPVIAAPARGAESSPGPSLSTPPGPSGDQSKPAPRKTFADKPSDRPEPKTRLVPKRAYPSDEPPAPTGEPAGDGTNGDGVPASGGSGAGPNSRETNYNPIRINPNPSSVDPEDRMTARPVRQATYYRPIAVPTASIAVPTASITVPTATIAAPIPIASTSLSSNDGGWHAATK